MSPTVNPILFIICDWCTMYEVIEGPVACPSCICLFLRIVKLG